MKPHTMSATKAARATAGRHLLINLARARFVPSEDEDLTETMVKLEKKKQRALKRKARKAARKVS